MARTLCDLHLCHILRTIGEYEVPRLRNQLFMLKFELVHRRPEVNIVNSTNGEHWGVQNRWPSLLLNCPKN